MLPVLIAIVVAPPVEREIPLAGAPGVHLFVSDGAGGEPKARIAAAREAMAAQLGKPLVRNGIETRSVRGVKLATVSERYADAPETIHGWMAVATSGSLCHIIGPAAPEAAAAIRPALERCGDILLGPVPKR